VCEVPELFPELRGLLSPPPAPPEEEPPINGEQVEMFEQWEKLGLQSLFDSLKPQETDHGMRK
jgi:hypothetical protein